MKTHTLLVALVHAMLLLTASAKLELNRSFSSGMVIQRDYPIRVCGLATAAQKITISLASSTRQTTVADDGKWQTELPALKAGGPYTLKIATGEETITMDDIWIGDVWLCSGQSNMQMGLHEVIGGTEALAQTSQHSDIHILSLPRAGADTPLMDIDAKWQRPTVETTKDFSAVAWFFAVQLKASPTLKHVPLGIINSSFGGTAIEAWTPANELPEISKDQLSGSMFGIAPGSMFNGMIAPLTQMKIKGVLWYQGEANAGHPTVYTSLLKHLMQSWRRAWQLPELPFYIVQLPAFSDTWDGYDYSWLREAQSKACSAATHSWFAVSYDTNDGSDLHPIEKQEICRRLSCLARQTTYHESITAFGPVLEKSEIRGTQIQLTFKNASHLTTSNQQAPCGFSIAGADGDYRYAKATLHGLCVTLENADIPAPQTVRYAWGGVPRGNLLNESGFPIPPFRTDDFSPVKTTLKPLPVIYKIETPNYQIITGEHGQIASLMIHGKQFLSNDQGTGTSIPDGFGTRNFGLVEEIGPHRLRMSDRTGSLEIACTDDTMEWILRNDRDAAFDFHVHLAPQAILHESAGSIDASRDYVSCHIDGQSHILPNPTPEIVTNVRPHSTTTITIRTTP